MSEADYNPSGEIRGVLIPVGQNSLLLPNAVVAEVIDYRDPSGEVDEADAAWLLGTVTWRQRKLPLVAFEGLLGETFSLPRRARIAICHALDPEAGYVYIGIVSGGIPRLVRVHEQVVKPLDLGEPYAGCPILARVQLNDQEVLIPDLLELGSLIGTLA